MAIDAEGRQVKTPESYEKDAICKYLDLIGAWYCRAFTGGFGTSGNPDIISCIDGTFWGIEVKREGKPLTVLQKRRLEAIAAAGGMTTWGTAEKVIARLSIFIEANKAAARLSLLPFFSDK